MWTTSTSSQIGHVSPGDRPTFRALVGLGDGEDGEATHVSVGLGVEAERPGEPVDDLGARVDGAGLFEARVPRHAHTRELGDLLSAKARRVAPAADRVDAEVISVQRGSPRTKSIVSLWLRPENRAIAAGRTAGSEGGSGQPGCQWWGQ